MTCEHYKKPCPFARGAEDGAWVCFNCSQNTAKGKWPARPPQAQAITVNGSPPPNHEPVPRDQWPAWAKWVSHHLKPADTGVGDTVARELGKGGEFFKAAIQAMGASCGCSARQSEWNQKYPYRTA